MATKAKIGVLGASGYTGGELVRVLLRHPRAEIVLLTAERSAGKAMREVFPQFSPFVLPPLVAIDGLDWSNAALDVAFCALPHATTQKVVKDLMAKSPETKVIDLSADFRLSDTAAYAKWYGHEHHAPELQKDAVYGLTEVHRREIRHARLVANPGCYTTCAQLPLVPLIKNKAIELDEIVVDAKSGMTGAGRAVREAMLFSEVSEGFHAYGVGHHRHMAELDQEFSAAAGREVVAPLLAGGERGAGGGRDVDVGRRPLGEGDRVVLVVPVEVTGERCLPAGGEVVVPLASTGERGAVRRDRVDLRGGAAGERDDVVLAVTGHIGR